MKHKKLKVGKTGAKLVFFFEILKKSAVFFAKLTKKSYLCTQKYAYIMKKVLFMAMVCVLASCSSQKPNYSNTGGYHLIDGAKQQRFAAAALQAVFFYIVQEPDY